MNSKRGHSISHTFRVRYAETDAMGLAHHSSYVIWMEMGRTEFMRAHSFTYRELEAMGVMMPVLELNVRYKQPSYYDDELRISTWVEELSRVRLVLGYEIVRLPEERLLAEGSTMHTFVGRDGRPIRITHYAEAWAKLQAMNI
jgi:acyl-CoA thioester hydrolase